VREGTFSFDVTFTGLAPWKYEFDMYGLVNGGRIATEHNIITVTVGTFSEPGTLLLLGSALLGLVGLRRKLYEVNRYLNQRI